MQSLDTGTYGAKVQSWNGANPSAILARLMETNPTASRDGIASLFWDEIKDDLDCLKAIALDYWLPNNYHRLSKPQSWQGGKGDESVVARAKRSVQSGIAKKVESGIKIALLRMQMPNGKELRNCNGRECLQFSKKIGGWLARLAAKLKPNELVGEKFDEADLRKLY